MRVRVAGALAGALLAGCGGATGTFSIELVTAPGSTLLASTARARLTLSQPFQQVEATRGDDGKYHLALEVPADGPAGIITFEGLDEAGNVIAWGRAAPLPIAAVDADVAIYVAAPESLAAAAQALDPPRSELALTRFSFGVLMVGGAAAGDVPVKDVDLYDVYGHELVGVADAPAARAGAVMGSGVTGYAYVFGGRGAAGPTGTFWRFDTTVGPSGQWFEISDTATLARSGAAIAPVRADAFVVTGDPPLVLDGISLSAAAVPDAPALAGTATSVERDADEEIFTVFAGDGSGAAGLVTLGPSGFTEHGGVTGAARVGHGAVPTRADTVLLAGGSVGGVPTAAGLLVDPAAPSFTELPDLLATPRTGAAIAGNGDVMLVAGGRDAGGALLGDAEVIDLASGARRAVIPMVVPRTGASAASLASGQIIVVGGLDDSGAPVGTIEVYNPRVGTP